MFSRATTYVSVLRGTSVDEFGDDVDTDTAIATKVPCSLLEQQRWVMDASTNTPMTVRTVVARVAANVDVATGDRIRDDYTGLFYIVEDVSHVQNPIMAVDKKLNLSHLD